MVIKEYIVEDRENMRGGEGTVTVKKWVDGDAMPPHVRFAATMVFPPGASIGVHVHEGESEIFNILSGRGEYNDNGKTVPIEKDDVLVCYNGEEHCIMNTGDEPLEVAAVIVTE